MGVVYFWKNNTFWSNDCNIAFYLILAAKIKTKNNETVS